MDIVMLGKKWSLFVRGLKNHYPEDAVFLDSAI
jgi:hypothetical protein